MLHGLEASWGGAEAADPATTLRIPRIPTVRIVHLLGGGYALCSSHRAEKGFRSRQCKGLLLSSVGHENRAGDFYFPVVMTSLVSLVTDRDLFMFVNIYTWRFDSLEKRGVRKHGGGGNGDFL